MICPADKHTLISVSVRLWGQQTPVYKVSLLCDMQGNESLSVLFLFTAVPDCLHTVKQIVALSQVSAVRLWTIEAQFKQVSPPKPWGGGSRCVCLSCLGKKEG